MPRLTYFLLSTLTCAGTVYFVDAMSSFGAVPLDVEASQIDFLVSSANKCLQGVPGFSYAIARKSALEKCEGTADFFYYYCQLYFKFIYIFLMGSLKK